MCSVIFFFSSRRRHTRCSRDWSSDVCSSDLPVDALPPGAGLPRARQRRVREPGAGFPVSPPAPGGQRASGEIGRASCRERVEISVGAGSLKKKKKEIIKKPKWHQ